jgi:hypothetical protein
LLTIIGDPFNSESQSISILPEVIITELSNQLHSWRDYLPPTLRWHDEGTIQDAPEGIVAECKVLRHGGLPYEIIDPVLLLNSSLRTRYKYVMYLIYRPYLYKALHEPDSVTTTELQGCKTALLVRSTRL